MEKREIDKHYAIMREAISELGIDYGTKAKGNGWFWYLEDEDQQKYIKYLFKFYEKDTIEQHFLYLFV